jgi:hypothetical protein
VGRVHPEFSVSIKRAKAAAALAYEESAGEIPPVLTIFGLKNMAPDDYRVASGIDQSGSGS